MQLVIYCRYKQTWITVLFFPVPPFIIEICRECEYNKNYLGVTFYAYALSSLQNKNWFYPTHLYRDPKAAEKNHNLNIREMYYLYAHESKCVIVNNRHIRLVIFGNFRFAGQEVNARSKVFEKSIIRYVYAALSSWIFILQCFIRDWEIM